MRVKRMITLLFSIVFVAMLMSFAQAAYNKAHETEDEKGNEITGMASGKMIGGGAAIVAGLVATLMSISGALGLKGQWIEERAIETCTYSAANPLEPGSKALCIALTVVGVLLIALGIMLMVQANKVKDGESGDTFMDKLGDGLEKAEDAKTLVQQLTQQCKMLKKNIISSLPEGLQGRINNIQLKKQELQDGFNNIITCSIKEKGDYAIRLYKDDEMIEEYTGTFGDGNFITFTKEIKTEKDIDETCLFIEEKKIKCIS